MIGTILNTLTVITGSMLGMLLGGRLTEKIRETVLHGLGLVTVVIGIQMAFDTTNILIVLGSILVGGILGEWWRLEDRLNSIGAWLEKRFSQRHDSEKPNQFIRGFVTASLLFCVGPMTILGAIQDGLSGDFRLLAIKAMLDGFASLAFASSLGIGVAFSALVVLIYQGGLSLLAAQVQDLLTEPMIAEMTATGGILIVGLGISTLLEIKPIRVGNFIPALFIAPLIIFVLSALGIATSLSF
jgi:uncharacterized membrane protein YqgA involved in biofilm formation